MFIENIYRNIMYINIYLSFCGFFFSHMFTHYPSHTFIPLVSLFFVVVVFVVDDDVMVTYVCCCLF